MRGAAEVGVVLCCCPRGAHIRRHVVAHARRGRWGFAGTLQLRCGRWRCRCCRPSDAQRRRARLQGAALSVALQLAGGVLRADTRAQAFACMGTPAASAQRADMGARQHTTHLALRSACGCGPAH